MELEEPKILHLDPKAARRLYIVLARLEHLYEISKPHLQSGKLTLTRLHLFS